MKRIRLAWCTPLVLAAALGCASGTSEQVSQGSGESRTISTSSNDDQGGSKPQPPVKENEQVTGLSATAAPGATAPKEGDEIAVMETTMGRIVLKFFPDKAPKHVEAFKKLAKSGFYDGIKFHRVIKGFMIQGGDPNTKGGDPATWGQGGPGYTLKAEFNDIKHTPGILSAARTPDPDSAGSQFFLMHETSPHLDGQYTVYGQVIEGMDVVNKIAETPTGPRDVPQTPVAIKSVKIETWPLKGA